MADQASQDKTDTGTNPPGVIPNPFARRGKVGRSPIRKSSISEGKENEKLVDNKKEEIVNKRNEGIKDYRNDENTKNKNSNKVYNEDDSSENENTSEPKNENKIRRKRKRGGNHIMQMTQAANREIFDKHYILKPENSQDFLKISPFQLQRELTEKIGTPEEATITKDGTLLLKAKDAKQAETIKNIQNIGQYQIKPESDVKRNTSKGVVTCWATKNCTEAELATELSSQNVIAAKKIKKKVENELVDTNTVILTFGTSKIPNYIELSMFFKLKVRPYIPAPMQCFNCQKFGHTAQRCSNDSICKCGLPVSSNHQCVNPPRCPNCGTNHTANSKDCISYENEKEIQRLKVIQGMTYKEAKTLVNHPAYWNKETKISYAEKASTSIQPLPKKQPESQANITNKPQQLNKDESIINQFTASPKPLKWHQKLNDDSYTDDSDYRENVQKKKKGWPKGKARKITNTQDNANNTENKAQTEQQI